MKSRKYWVITRDLFLSTAEVKALYRALGEAMAVSVQLGAKTTHMRDYYVLRLLLETGLRAFEFVSLRVSDFRGSSLTVRCGKGGKPRTVLLSRRTQQMLEELIERKTSLFKESLEPESPLIPSERGRFYTTRGLAKRVKYWFARLGFSNDLSVHSCRHTYISHLMAAGVDLPTIRDNAGHSSLAVTSIYSHAIRDGLGDLDLYGSSDFRGSRNSVLKS